MRGCSLGMRLRSEARRGRTRRAVAGRLRIAWAGVRRASWVRNSGRWQVDLETVIGEAIGLLGSVE